jgi:3-hydroxyisobutyrate dehydrogenase-like beta-hydroxyacid dehydrogenase
VAVLGTGKMGLAIAGRLAGAGYDLTLWDRTRSRAEALGHGRVAASPAAASRDAAVVISSSPEPMRSAPPISGRAAPSLARTGRRSST